MQIARIDRNRGPSQVSTLSHLEQVIFSLSIDWNRYETRAKVRGHGCDYERGVRLRLFDRRLDSLGLFLFWNDICQAKEEGIFQCATYPIMECEINVQCRILTQRDNPVQFGRFNNDRDAAVSRIVVCRWCCSILDSGRSFRTRTKSYNIFASM